MTTATLALEPRARLTDLFAAEWIKLWSLRSTAWTLPLIALAVLGLNLGTAWDQVRYWDQRSPADQAGFIADGLAMMTAYTSNGASVLLLAVGAWGAVTVTGEYGTGLIRTTFVAVPARSSVMVAKALVVAAVATAFGALLAAASFWVTQAQYAEHHAGVTIGHPGALRLVVASALLAPVAALAGMAVGALLRHGAFSVVAATVLLLIVPAFLSTRRHGTAVLAHAMPFRAWETLAERSDLAALEPYPATPGGAWLVLACWAAGSVLVTALAVRRRDQ
ncbi:positive regulator of sigma E activity [Kitasatospora gansuensis]|uniref:Positive regulator of sigma E activity n=1 Tax=Kitasatospora gansuensis TaxID=258050 RepID=A0A7W7SJZ1_9ACTN|nr:ABC transporter permease [Kitasatospora gansuensis]MBB4951278.1 positive regulator of sigma E activity [Kitasatospora gansuensis]